MDPRVDETCCTYNEGPEFTKWPETRGAIVSIGDTDKQQSLQDAFKGWKKSKSKAKKVQYVCPWEHDGDGLLKPLPTAFHFTRNRPKKKRSSWLSDRQTQAGSKSCA